ncbi:unnamed protein product [Cylindrotheca closterium]|uniref:Uncharacterized protein n=1 Tax=Cylindrotheca closterium TaxID=2856 RepID=A0AAD2G5V9_9STRA|nr:unnamed protein product [Cylindrotheca closterium]
MREIPSLQVLCLRSVGGLGCSAERTFDPNKGKKKKNENKRGNNSNAKQDDNLPQNPTSASKLLQSFDGEIKINRTPAIGKGAVRRKQANDVDLNHPWIGIWSSDDRETQVLQMEYGSPSLDVLQCFIDSLVELGRMDDCKLGVHFFREWKANVLAKKESNTVVVKSKSRKQTPPKKKARREQEVSVKLGSLSLHNSVLGEDTVNAMVESKMASHLAVLDMTGIQPLTDDLLFPILKDASNLKRLSVKNCRRLTSKTLEHLGQYTSQLTSLDIGGAYNLKPQAVLEACANLFYLDELYASGLGWTDGLLQELTSLRGWKGLSMGFAPLLTAGGFKAAMLSQTKSLISLSIPFCEQMVDAALLGALGRHLPLLRALDVRGNTNLVSLTGWYDGRATLAPKPEAQPLLVLARYSGVAKASLEDTKRIHPLDALHLDCILDSDGIGLGIQRTMEVPSENNDEEMQL